MQCSNNSELKRRYFVPYDMFHGVLSYGLVSVDDPQERYYDEICMGSMWANSLSSFVLSLLNGESVKDVLGFEVDDEEGLLSLVITLKLELVRYGIGIDDYFVDFVFAPSREWVYVETELVQPE